MTKPVKHNLQVYQGTTFRELLRLATYPYAVKTVNGVVVRADTGAAAPDSDRIPVDLTGCTARMQVRTAVSSQAVLLSLTTENGGITLGGAAGTIALYISDADTAALHWAAGVYDLEIEFPNGDVVRRLYGSVSVSPEITRV